VSQLSSIMSQNSNRYQREILRRRGWTVKRRRKPKCEIHDPPRVIEEETQETQESRETDAREEWLLFEDGNW
jgi:hypothetical protein